MENETPEMDPETPELTEQEAKALAVVAEHPGSATEASKVAPEQPDTTARDAKRAFNGAIRKLRAAQERGELTPLEAKAMRDSWYVGGEIPAEYLG